MAPPGFGEMEGLDRVVGEDPIEQQAQVEEPPVHVLQDQREAGLTPVTGMGLPYRAGGW